MVMPLVSAIVLAAGKSSRMNGPHKLTLDTGGIPMIRRTVQAVLGVRPVETVVVTGFAEGKVTAALAGLPVRYTYNPQYEDGQPGSVAAGMRALNAFCHAVMVVPGDQALLRPVHLADLIAAYTESDRSILVPFHKGQRGNPVIFAASHILDVTASGLNIGCRRLVEARPDEVAQVEFDADAFTFDCDTPADYLRLIGRIVDRQTPARADLVRSER